MFWFVCLFAVAYVVAIILKGTGAESFRHYSSLGLAFRIVLLGIGLLVIFIVLFLTTHWNKPIGEW